MKENKVVYTYGAWDLLHSGHLNMLEKAKSHGDILIVGVVGDKVITKFKGKPKPIQQLKERLRIISSLRCVDIAIVQETYNPTPNLDAHRPDIVVKGEEGQKVDKGTGILDAVEWCKKNKKIMIKPPYTQGVSTTKIIKRMKR